MVANLILHPLCFLERELMHFYRRICRYRIAEAARKSIVGFALFLAWSWQRGLGQPRDLAIWGSTGEADNVRKVFSGSWSQVGHTMSDEGILGRSNSWESLS